MVKSYWCRYFYDTTEHTSPPFISGNFFCFYSSGIEISRAWKAGWVGSVLFVQEDILGQALSSSPLASLSTYLFISHVCLWNFEISQMRLSDAHGHMQINWRWREEFEGQFIMSPATRRHILICFNHHLIPNIGKSERYFHLLHVWLEVF